jgi:hypothetical protein
MFPLLDGLSFVDSEASFADLAPIECAASTFGSKAYPTKKKKGSGII